MRVYISADIEGVTGVVSWKQCGSPSAEHYDWAFARRMMTHDVNAAIRGAIAGGATRVVVKDSHNTGKNLLISDLEPGTELISGTGAGDLGMMEGVDQGFDVAFLVGYHAMAGTGYGIMEHTISGRVHRFWVNGEEWGEQRMSATAAAACGVPLALVVSDDKGCAEAHTWGGDLMHSFVTKYGMGRYMGRLLHPSVTGEGIQAAAQAAMSAAGKSPALPLPETNHLRLEVNRSEEADAVAQLADWHRRDGYTVEWEGEGGWPAAHIAARRAMAVMGLANQN